MEMEVVRLSLLCASLTSYLVLFASGATLLPDSEAGALKEIGQALQKSWDFSVDPCSGKSGAGFTVEAKKVIRFLNLHPRTRRQFLRNQLGDSVDHLFPDSLTSRTHSLPMAEGDLPPVPIMSRKRKAVPPTGATKNSRSTIGAPGASSSASGSAPQSSSSIHVSNISPSTTPDSTSQAVGVMTTQPSSAGPSAPSGSNQGSTLFGSRVPRVTDSSALWKPIFKDLSGRLLTIGHSGRECSSVAGLIQNNITLPKDVDFMKQQTSGYLALLSAQSRYNATAADHAMSNRLLRYEDYITSICQSLGCTRQDSILSRLNELKAEADKGKNALNRVAELEQELEKTKGATEKVHALNKELDKEKAEVAVLKSSLARAKADKEVAVQELVDVKLSLAKEAKGREEAEGTIAKWRPLYELGCRKITSLLNISQVHMNECRSFRTVIRPFLAEFEDDILDEFDAGTIAMDQGFVVESPVVDKPLVTQSDELVDITEAQRRDELHPNPEE